MMCNPLRLAVVAAGLISFSVWAQPSLALSSVFDRDDETLLMSSFPNSQAAYDQFTGSLNWFGVDDIETDAGFNPTLDFGLGITAVTQGVLVQSAPTFQIGTQALLEQDAFFPQVNTVFTFNEYIHAFGLFVVQGGDLANNHSLVLRLRDTADSSFVDISPIQIGPGWGDNNVFFLGVSDTTPFNEVEFLEGADAGDVMLYDNIVVGRIPEPNSLVLLVLGAACALGKSRGIRRGSGLQK